LVGSIYQLKVLLFVVRKAHRQLVLIPPTHDSRLHYILHNFSLEIKEDSVCSFRACLWDRIIRNDTSFPTVFKYSHVPPIRRFRFLLKTKGSIQRLTVKS
jgi:hypothetical protein